MTKYVICFYDNYDKVLYETYVTTKEWYISAIVTAAQRYAAFNSGVTPTRITCRESR